MAMLLHLLSAEDIGVVCLEVFVFLPVENWAHGLTDEAKSLPLNTVSMSPMSPPQLHPSTFAHLWDHVAKAGSELFDLPLRCWGYRCEPTLPVVSLEDYFSHSPYRHKSEMKHFEMKIRRAVHSLELEIKAYPCSCLPCTLSCTLRSCNLNTPVPTSEDGHNGLLIRFQSRGVCLWQTGSPDGVGGNLEGRG